MTAVTDHQRDYEDFISDLADFTDKEKSNEFVNKYHKQKRQPLFLSSDDSNIEEDPNKDAGQEH